MEWTPAHRAIQQLEGEERGRARGNQRADVLAKGALNRRPGLSPQQRANLQRETHVAGLACKLAAEVWHLWPAARPPGARTRRKRRKPQQPPPPPLFTDTAAAGDNGHTWARWRAATWCMACGTGGAGHRACERWPKYLSAVAVLAQNSGHEVLWVSRVPGGDIALFCGRCGAASAGAAPPRGRLATQCTGQPATDGGRRALRRVGRGWHPVRPGRAPTTLPRLWAIARPEAAAIAPRPPGAAGPLQEGGQ